MNIEEFRSFCLNLKAVNEEFPFGPDTLVYKVGGKIFAMTGLNTGYFKVNLKHNPEYNEELRDRYDEVEAGYHMNKYHWNTVNFEGHLSDGFLKELICNSYERVVNGLSKKKKAELSLL